MVEIDVDGGGVSNHALVHGNLLMFREGDEPVPEFRQRVREFALSINADTVLFALPDSIVWVDDLPIDDEPEGEE
jgi:hypothetical protein